MQTIDQNVLNFFVSTRVDWFSFLMLIITYSGGYLLIGGLAILSVVSFYIHRHYSRILPLFVSIGGSATTVYLLKHIFYKARPITEAVYLETSSSFPSGHATMAMALYGFIFLTIWQHEKHPLKNKSLILLSLLIIFVGVSRLYLGVHFLSDVLAGYAIGLIWLWISHLVSKLKIWPLRGNEHL